MPLPRSHSKSLQRQLRVHEERLALLRSQLNDVLEGEMRHEEVPAGAGDKERGSDVRQKTSKATRDPNPKVRSPEWVAGQRELLEREIRIHEQLIELGRNPKVLDALGDLAENRDYAGEAARDPKGAARKRGIELPANMMLHLDLELDRVQLEISYWEDLFPFRVTWNSDSGFSPLREPGSSRNESSGIS
jgi:hypothetical protein